MAPQGHVIDAIKEYLQRLIIFSVSYVPCHGNDVAHTIAGVAASSNEEKTWCGDP